MKYIAVFVIASLPIFSIAQKKQVEIAGSQRESFHSKITSQEYELQILLPASVGKEKKKYPVIYVMDSQWDFTLVEALRGELYFDGFIPETIVVGVTWAGPKAKPDSLRFRDYSPTNVLWVPQSGGADKFLSFMKSELIPYIEKKYSGLL